MILLPSIPPEILEAGRRQLGIAHRMLNIPVPQIRRQALATSFYWAFVTVRRRSPGGRQVIRSGEHDVGRHVISLTDKKSVLRHLHEQ